MLAVGAALAHVATRNRHVACRRGDVELVQPRLSWSGPTVDLLDADDLHWLSASKRNPPAALRTVGAAGMNVF